MDVQGYIRGGQLRNGAMKRHVLICGGGVIGASIAYFLSRRGIKATVIDRTGIACAASGKSGGFLARDWCDGTPVQALARRSFDLHAELADRLGIDWNYRRLMTYGGFAPLRHRGPHAPGWLSERVAVGRRLGSAETTAQVHPARFTTAMMRAAEAKWCIRQVACDFSEAGALHGAPVRAGEVAMTLRVRALSEEEAHRLAR